MKKKTYRKIFLIKSNNKFNEKYFSGFGPGNNNGNTYFFKKMVIDNFQETSKIYYYIIISCKTFPVLLLNLVYFLKKPKSIKQRFIHFLDDFDL